MEYKLDKDRSLEENISLLFDAEISGCILSLREAELHMAMHDIRKRLKKLRALARLFRDEMGEEKYQSINIRFRDLGKQISEIRDLSAHLETLEKLKARYGNYLSKSFLDPVQQKLESERKNLTELLSRKGFFEDYLPRELNKMKGGSSLISFKAQDIMMILPGIERVYSRGKRAMEKAFETGTTVSFHEWRKRAKYLWYQILLLRDIWPEYLDSLEAELHLLADHLGDDHDLMIFKEKLLDTNFNMEDSGEQEMYEALISEYSENLRSEAKAKGELIYAERPEDFKKRIAGYTRVHWK